MKEKSFPLSDYPCDGYLFSVHNHPENVDEFIVRYTKDGKTKTVRTYIDWNGVKVDER